MSSDSAIEELRMRLTKIEADRSEERQRIEEMRKDMSEKMSLDRVTVSMVKANNKALFGNGRPGLIHDFNKQTAQLETVIKWMKWQVGTFIALVGPVAYIAFELSR